MITGGSFGAGNYALCGKAFDPRFIFAWPTAHVAVMGADQAADTLLEVTVKSLQRQGDTTDAAELEELRDKVAADYERQTDVRYAAARGWVDAILDPATTRGLADSGARSRHAPCRAGTVSAGRVSGLINRKIEWRRSRLPTAQVFSATISMRRGCWSRTRQVDYLTLEYLAELTMSILARPREGSGDWLCARFYRRAQSLVPALQSQPQLKIVTNAGGMNPVACATAAGKILSEAGLADVRIGVVTGDDVLPKIVMQDILSIRPLTTAGVSVRESRHWPAACRIAAPESSVPMPILGARPIADALADGAQIVITGRVADASLTVGPAMHEFRRKWDDWNFLAGASVAGHLIECGARSPAGSIGIGKT